MAIEISTIAQLQLIGNDPGYPLDGDYVLTQDIDASDTVNWNGGAGFEPIGTTLDAPFSGTFDGQFYLIDGITINRPSTDVVGVFKGISGTVTNLAINGSVIGKNNTAIISGGLTGTINKCFSTGIASGIQYVSGLVSCGNGTISDSYSTASVSGDRYVSGFVSMVYSASIITNCYSAGSVNAILDFKGFIASAQTGHVESNCYWDIETSGCETSVGGTGKTTEEMKQAGTFEGWDFANVWWMPPGDYPRLRSTGEVFSFATIQEWIDALLSLLGLGHTKAEALSLLGEPPGAGRHEFVLRGGRYETINQITPPYRIYLGMNLLPYWFSGTWVQKLNEPDTLTFQYPANLPNANNLHRGGGLLYLKDDNDRILGAFRIRNFTPAIARNGSEIVVNVEAESLLAALDDSAVLTYSPGNMSLAEDIDDEALEFTGSGVDDYPSGTLKIMVDREIMTASHTGATFKISARGVDGTTPAEHKAGAQIRLALTIRKHIERLLEDYNKSGVKFGSVYSALNVDKYFVALDNMTLLDAIRQFHTLSGHRGQYHVDISGYFYWLERINTNYKNVILGYNLESWSRQEDPSQLCTVLVLRGAGPSPATRVSLPSIYVENNTELYGSVARVMVREDISDPKTLEQVAHALIKEISVPALHYTCSAAENPDTAFITGIGSKIYLSDPQVSISNIELNVVGITRSLDNPVDVTYEFDRKVVNTEAIIESVVARMQRTENRDVSEIVNAGIQTGEIRLPVTEIPWETPGTIGSTTPNTGKFTSCEIGDRVFSAGNLELKSEPAASNTAQIRLSPIAAQKTEPCYVQVFQSTNTSGERIFIVYKGDGSSTRMFEVYSDTGLVQCTGEVRTPASTTDRAGLRLPHGTAPSSPVDGQLWTTTSGMYVRINGTTIGPLIDANGIPWAVPGAIGGTTPNTGKFTTLEATGDITTNGMIDRKGRQTIRSNPTAGEAQIYLAPDPQDGTSTATLGIFRTTNTSGTRQLVVYKGDGSNTEECKISNGKIYTRASTSAAAGIVLPHGVAPSSPSNGDMWTTTSGMYVRINGKTIGPLGSAKWKRYGGA